MRRSVLIVPGYRGSGAAHWQTWMEQRLPDARRLRGVDWDTPILANWAGALRREVDAAPGAVWLVAHSFGCLASVVAAADRPAKVAGLLLVAPADPQRFGLLGLRDAGTPSLAAALPAQALRVPSLVVASQDDPWLAPAAARDWAARWGSRIVDIGCAGHVNVDSGHGPWPAGLALLQRLFDTAPHCAPVEPGDSRGRGSALARLRHHTRRNLHRAQRGDWTGEPAATPEPIC
jgi:predicted alpha/beta hydrolase family esterase